MVKVLLNIFSTLFTTLFLSTHVFASNEILDQFRYSKGENCSEVRLDLPPGVMSKIPVLDQSDTNLCWAYSGTQLIDAWIIKNDPPLKYSMSPLPAALQFKVNKNQLDLIEYESVYHFLSEASKLNSCSYKVFDTKNQYKTLGDFLSDLFEAQKKSTSATEIAEKLNECIIKAGIKNKLDIKRVSDQIIKGNSLSNINAVIQDLCKDDRISLQSIPKPKYLSVSSSGNIGLGMSKMRKLIDDRLNNKQTPPAVRFCYGMLADRGLVTMGTNGKINESTCKTAIHFSPIVGRRVSIYTNPKTGKQTPFCQYLLRDSRGTSCAKYPNEPEMNPSDKCVKGQVWVDEDTLFTNSDESTYLTDKDEL